jgi:adenosylhomocysteinase
MRHLSIVGNIGHFDNEIRVADLLSYPGIKKETIKPQGFFFFIFFKWF